jgi:hypothetical protein
MNRRPGGEHQRGRIARRRRSRLLTGHDRIVQQMERAQARSRRAGGHRVAVKHDPEITRMRDRKAHVGSSERLESGGALGRRPIAFGDEAGLKIYESVLGDPSQQLLPIGEVMIGRPGGHPDMRRQFAQIQGVESSFGDHLDRGLDQRAPQVPMVIVLLCF